MPKRPTRLGVGGPVGADLGVMERDARRMRGERPVIFANLKDGSGLDEVIQWVRRELLDPAVNGW